MNKPQVSLLFVALFVPVLAHSQTVAAPNWPDARPPEKKIVALTLELSDGTHLRATPLFATLALQTEMMKLDLPLDRIEAIALSPNREQTKVRLRNGDQLTGTLLQETLAVTSLVGRLNIPMSLVQRLSVLTQGGSGDGPVAYWSFNDGTGKDSVGQNDASMVGHVSFVTSPFGRAMRLTNSRTYARVSSKGINVNGWAAITISVWVKPRQYTTYCNVISRGTDSRGTIYGLTLNPSSKGSFGVATGAGPEGVGGAGVEFRTYSNGAGSYPPVGRWYHLVGTYDGEKARCFVNGELDGEAATKTPGALIWDTDESMTYFGTSAALPYRDWGDQYFDGQMDEIKIWQRALSSAEIKALYKVGASKLDADATVDPEAVPRTFITR